MASQGRNRVAFNKTASGDLVAAVTGGRIVLYGITAIASAVLTVSINDGSGGAALWGPADIPAGGFDHAATNYPYLAQTTISTALYMTISGTGNIGGVVEYVVE